MLEGVRLTQTELFKIKEETLSSLFFLSIPQLEHI